MTAKYATLAELAQKATPGPWAAVLDDPMERGGTRNYVGLADRFGYVCPAKREDAAYIAAASPDVVLALLARVQAAEAVVAAGQEWRGAHDETHAASVALTSCGHPAEETDEPCPEVHRIIAASERYGAAERGLREALAAYDKTIRAPKGGSQP